MVFLLVGFVAFVDAEDAQVARLGHDFVQRLPHERIERMPRHDRVEAVLPGRRRQRARDEALQV